MPILFVPFHAEKDGVFIGPNDFKIGAKKYHIPIFRGTSGTTAITRWYYRLQSDTGWYHYLTGVVPLPDRGSTTAQTTWENGSPKRCYRRLCFQGLNGLFNPAQFSPIKGLVGP